MDMDSDDNFESADEDFDVEPRKATPDHAEASLAPKTEKIEKKTTSNTTETTTKTPKNDLIPDSAPKETTDGWDIDDWGEEDEVEAAAAQPVAPVKPKVETERPSAAQFEEMTVKPSETVPDVRNALDRLDRGASKESWGGWGLSFLNTASKSVASITTHVSQGISKTLEGGLAPSPEELARTVVAEEKQKQSSPTSEEERESSSHFDHLLSGVSNISSKVINHSLDTLEGIGKKTMSIIQENDPGLLKRHRLLMDGDKPVLSQVLREAKEKTEEAEKKMKQIQKKSYHKKVHFETLFDDYCGIVHLEALEMLSKQAQIKLQSLLAPLSGKALEEMEQTLTEVEELCELPELEDEAQNHSLEELEQRLKAITEELTVTLEFDDITGCWKKYTDWLDSDQATGTSPKPVYEKSMHCLAETAALAVAKIHKLAEKYLILEQHSTANEVDSLVELTVCFCWHISGVAARFGEALSTFNMDEDNNTYITSIFLEATNSNKFLQNAFGLVIPIIQLGAA